MEISAYLVFIYYAYVYNVLHFILNQSINQSIPGHGKSAGRVFAEASNHHQATERFAEQINKWRWGQIQAHAFEEVKRELSQTHVLALYHPNRETTVSADASSFGLEAVLLHRHEEAMRPIAYAIRATAATEQRY